MTNSILEEPMSDEITNIVPIGQTPEPKDVKLAEDQLEIVFKEEDNAAYSRRLAKDAIDFLETDFPDDIDSSFWETIRDAANKKLGNEVKVEEITPMTQEQAKDFASQELPFGKFMGQRVLTVWKRDKAYLESMIRKPLPFQIRLQKFLASPLDQFFKEKPSYKKT